MDVDSNMDIYGWTKTGNEIVRYMEILRLAVTVVIDIHRMGGYSESDIEYNN